MYALRRSRVLGVRSGVLVAWARRMHPMHGQRTAPRQESRKWTADPGPRADVARFAGRPPESQTRHPSSLPLSILRPGGAAAVPGAPVSAAALRSARLGCARSVCCRAEQPARCCAGRVERGRPEREYAVPGRRVRTPAGRWVSVMAAGDVSSMGLDARARRPLCVLTRADRRRNCGARTPFWGARNFVRIDYREWW